MCVCVPIYWECVSRSRAFPSSRLGKFAFTRMTLTGSTPSLPYHHGQSHQSIQSRLTMNRQVLRLWWIWFLEFDCQATLVRVWREFLLDLDQCIHLLRCFFWRFDVNKNMCDMSECQSIFQCNALKTDQFVWKEVVSLRAINIMVRRIFWCILNKQTSQF